MVIRGGCQIDSDVAHLFELGNCAHFGTKISLFPGLETARSHRGSVIVLLCILQHVWKYNYKRLFLLGVYCQIVHTLGAGIGV
jgi:hypothetical protein